MMLLSYNSIMYDQIMVYTIHGVVLMCSRLHFEFSVVVSTFISV
ncbi:hypothetical protein GMOD_00002621 [Pyrenophora seminiperda CCB06]|uniref:Uncharacterized protein n=1 Tax=Pyrenophora seminiperda CCB06 TaxID=1302712 RepID=A0A3M7M2M6_9PLEO|nr:hypothetical protein GMOD_00002621 [Pyrenophora seminiperda CCB06]